MGFFSDLKKNITGGWADLTMTTQPAERGGVARLTLHLSVKDDPIDVSKIEARVRCQEIVQVQTSRTTTTPGTNGAPPRTSTSPTTQSETETLFSQNVIVAPARTFEGGTQETFEVEVPLPTHAPPSLVGRNARFEWQAYASVDMKGNDPDTGWQTFEVR